MTALRPLGLLVAVAGAGFAGTIATGAAAGLHRGSLAHLAALILPALAVTVLATGIARAALGRASIRVSMTAVAAVGAAAGLANLAALAMLMIVGRPDATLVGVLLIYAAAAGAGAGLGLALAKRIAEALGGCLEVQNKPPAGARFAIRIPPPAAANRSVQSG
jgi:hypothetical protein